VLTTRGQTEVEVQTFARVWMELQVHLLHDQQKYVRAPSSWTNHVCKWELAMVLTYSEAAVKHNMNSEFQSLVKNPHE
jgi:hypothetical protein